ncbi:hypothetical protein [Porphyrobacter sp. CACIAM 03H1]|uniref:hypothetical protein n=1 Tax=Porphyrobacter sp. CACIAM 03H1 TaxID=2003315 RepID=UPI0012FE7539|nr:hypothetical protein [Porphyrobacter sp. CACIAM 03H1]
MSITETAGEHSRVKVEERVIPVPVSISPEAQARLHEAVGPDGLPQSAPHFALEEVVKHEMGGRDDHHEFPALGTERVQLIGIHGFGEKLVFPLHGLISVCCGVRTWVDSHDAQHRKSRTVPVLRRSASGQ